MGACIFLTSNSSGSLCLSDIVPSTHQHNTTGWSDQTTPPINTVPQGGQIIVHSTHQHSTTGWSDHHALHPSTQYHRVVRSSCTPPINTVPQGGQIIMHSTHQHSTTGWSDHHALHPSRQYHRVVRWRVCEERGGL